MSHNAGILGRMFLNPIWTVRFIWNGSHFMPQNQVLTSGPIASCRTMSISSPFRINLTLSPEPSIKDICDIRSMSIGATVVLDTCGRAGFSRALWTNCTHTAPSGMWNVTRFVPAWWQKPKTIPGPAPVRTSRAKATHYCKTTIGFEKTQKIGVAIWPRVKTMCGFNLSVTPATQAFHLAQPISLPDWKRNWAANYCLCQGGGPRQRCKLNNRRCPYLFARRPHFDLQIRSKRPVLLLHDVTRRHQITLSSVPKFREINRERSPMPSDDRIAARLLRPNSKSRRHRPGNRALRRTDGAVTRDRHQPDDRQKCQYGMSVKAAHRAPPLFEIPSHRA